MRKIKPTKFQKSVVLSTSLVNDVIFIIESFLVFPNNTLFEMKFKPTSIPTYGRISNNDLVGIISSKWTSKDGIQYLLGFVKTTPLLKNFTNGWVFIDQAINPIQFKSNVGFAYDDKDMTLQSLNFQFIYCPDGKIEIWTD